MPYGRIFRRRYSYRPSVRRYAVRRRMLYRRRLPFRSRRRWGSRRRVSYRRSVTRIPRIPLPNIMYLKFHFAESISGTVNSTAPVYAFLGYANNPYDPVVGASTVGCSGFNAIMSIYQWCLCFACKVRVTTQQTSTNSIEGYCYILMENHDALRSNSATAAISLDLLRENPIHVKSRLMYNYQYNTRPTTISMYRRIKTLESVGVLDPDKYRCSRTSGPSLNSRFTFGYRTSDNTMATAQTVRQHFKVTYYCRVYERANLDQ